ncbi:unnamed protein product [Ostreobium quekettii]|uniref:RING-type domain-containing protein n=1 Tax=Ostreobium quekettii TaxID=121088 RepID=A0A8S1IWQ5_9CHLO|nr:unnamed protein product [Ostreobium quekettii]
MRNLRLAGPAARALPVVLGAMAVFGVARMGTGVPLSIWGPVSAGVWFAYAALAGWDRLGYVEQLGVLWGAASAYSFVAFLHKETSFQGWGDVYFFCGPLHEYCTCGFRWNLLGWWKAVTVWNFSIASAVGLQKLALQLGLGGLLPGEEVVTKDSFISVCWRLVPYWLNNWEQNWGTECSSMLFEVPRFALELLVILPCVQILCSRLKILAAAQIRVVVPEQEAGMVSRENIAANVIKGHWEVDPSQRNMMKRLRCNMRIMAFIVCLLVMAGLNSLWVPLRLEQESLNHPRSDMAIEAGQALESGSNTFGLRAQCAACPAGWPFKVADVPGPGPQCMDSDVEYVESLKTAYLDKRQCRDMEILKWSIRKHSVELGRMRDEDHQRMIPLIEIALAMMRFSCEKFFVLLTVYVNYLLFREPPPFARTLVLVNNALSMIFQHVVLYTFPAICWAYGAGVVFSTFVSLIFWAGPLMGAYRHFTKAFMLTLPKDLSPAMPHHVERMGNNCAICWGTLKAAAFNGALTKSAGSALPCGHAFHAACLTQWMDQCLVQQRAPKCPMCQSDIQYRVCVRWPWSQSPALPGTSGAGGANAQVRPVTDQGPQAEAEGGDEDFLFGDPNLQGLLDDMPDILADVVEDEGHVQRILGRHEFDGLIGEDESGASEGEASEEGGEAGGEGGGWDACDNGVDLASSPDSGASPGQSCRTLGAGEDSQGGDWAGSSGGGQDGIGSEDVASLSASFQQLRLREGPSVSRSCMGFGQDGLVASGSEPQLRNSPVEGCEGSTTGYEGHAAGAVSGSARAGEAHRPMGQVVSQLPLEKPWLGPAQ